jgi:uncharacterized protein YjlB
MRATNGRSHRLLPSSLFAICAFLLLCWPAGTAAQCNFTTLTSGVTATTTSGRDYFEINQGSIYWTAVGIRSSGTDDWDMALYDTWLGGMEFCVEGLHANSLATSGVDFVVGDYNHSPLGTEYPEANRYAGNLNGTVEWDSGQDALSVNGPGVSRATGSNDVLEVWDVLLEGGREYTFEFERAGSADSRLLLFRNPASSPYWAGRSSRQFETTGTTTYTAPATDWYGVVVVNDNGGSGSYTVAVGTCMPPVALASGITVQTAAPVGHYRFNQPSIYWTAVGVRAPGSDWDLQIFQDDTGSPWPVCFSGMLANSQAVGIADFVVGDFNHNSLGAYYARPFQFSGSGDAVTEWDDGPDLLSVNGGVVSRETGPTDLLEIWDVFLEAGVEYSFQFERAGSADAKLLLFRNPASAPYWAGRGFGQFETTTTTTYTAPANDWYGVVVVNDNGGTGSYTLSVGTCAPQIPLTSGVSVPTPAPVGHYSFNQQSQRWVVVGVLPIPLPGPEQVDDWNIEVYLDETGSPWPVCFSGLLASSTETGVTDVIVGDFHANPLGTYYPRVYCAGAGCLDNSRIEWEVATPLPVGQPPIFRTTSASDFLQIWEVFLEAGQQYILQFNPTDIGGLRLLLFRNLSPPGGEFWGSRSQAVVNTDEGTVYGAPETGWYTAVVVNDDGGEGGYQIGVARGTTAVESPGESPVPPGTRLLPITPNPVLGTVAIGFDLGAPGNVAFSVFDVHGRPVATLPAGFWQSGTWETSWNGRGSDGRRLPAGVYLLRMTLDARQVGENKFLLLR